MSVADSTHEVQRRRMHSRRSDIISHKYSLGLKIAHVYKVELALTLLTVSICLILQSAAVYAKTSTPVMNEQA